MARQRFDAPQRVLAELADLGPYFAVGIGPVDDGWRPVEQLYTDAALLHGIVDRIQARMDAAEQRVAASTFFLGFAARLWSIGLGALAGHRLLLDLDAERLLFQESGGQIQLHIEHPAAWQGDDLEPMLTDMVLDRHLAPLCSAPRMSSTAMPQTGPDGNWPVGYAPMKDLRPQSVSPKRPIAGPTAASTTARPAAGCAATVCSRISPGSA